VVVNSLGPSVAQLPMVVALGFLLPSLVVEAASLILGGMAPLVSVPSIPLVDGYHHIIL